MNIITKGKTKEELIEIIKELEKKVYTDDLTGAYTRTWFYENIKPSDKLYITMVDLNSLKDTNDKFGHLAGDKFLIRVTKSLKKYGDLIRYGGDEFLVITKDKELFEKLNKKKLKDYCCGGADSFNCTIPEAIRKADEIMYKIKKLNKKGRD